MDFLSCILWLCLIWILIKTFHMIPRSKATHSKLPPGPKPFPVIGNLLELGEKPHKSLSKLAKAHGPIMSLKLGKVTTIVISSADIAKEVLQTHDRLLADRTIPDAIRVYNSEEYSLPWIPISARWRNVRKICSGELFANRILDANEDIRHKKVQELLTETHQCGLTGEAVDIGKAVFKTTLNLLSNTIFSVDLAGKDSDKAGVLKELIWNVMKEAATPNLADFFPVLKKVDPQGIRRRMAGHARMIMDLFDGMINQRMQLRKLSGSITDSDFLDILLSISEEKSEEIDRTTILHLLRVSVITPSLFLILGNSFIISLFLFIFYFLFLFSYIYIYIYE
jgi:cytochrome P450